ncbi:manganese transporter smf1 [Zygosaccharomyces mellis]|uniref:Manganese transporter smf1 n=1 Tax=Zygosaccharomyces mellis TaxID=42258 RepID=A0A4C2ECC6_9SACH|nr:manganese transporter smf1 [Zygosaccharomyces mellis]
MSSVRAGQTGAVDRSNKALSREAAKESIVQKTVSLDAANVDTNLNCDLDYENEVNKRHELWETVKAVGKKYAKFVGPGLLVSVAYIDPGNYSTSVSAGASNQFSLLCIILLSNFIAIFLQCLCIKLGSVTGLDLSRACRTYLPRWINLVLYVFAECAIIATDVAEVIGTAVALNILLKIPLPAGVVITIVDVFAVMFTYKQGTSSLKFIKYFEYSVALLVLGVCVCFAVELTYLPEGTSVTKVFRGFVPSSQMVENGGLYTAISILGATVMPHSLFLGSGLVQPRLLNYDITRGNYSVADSELEGKRTDEEIRDQKYFEYRPSMEAIKYCMKYSFVELALTLFTLALFVNCSILIVAGATLYGTPGAADADLYSIHTLLSHKIAPAVGTLFMVALLLSGQSAGVVCTMAGQIVSEGHINWTLKPWQRRLLTRCISLIPCLVISICIGRQALSKALNASQVVLSILLPFLVAPLIFFTCKKSVMRVEISEENTDADAFENERRTRTVNMANNWITSICAVLVWIFLCFLNVYAIVELGLSGGDIS